MYENLRLLQHAHAASGLGQVLLGLDFRLFNESYVNRAFSEDRMLVRATGERNTAVYSTILADLFGTLLSLDALQGSVNTVRFQGWNAETLFAGGRWDRKNPAYNHQDAFRAYTNASIRRFSKVPDSLEGLEDFRRLVRFAHREDIDVRMFISPSHVIHWLLVQRMGLWPRFQQLKRELVKINIDEARRIGRDPFPLWDFSGVNSVTVELVPPDGEDEHMEWFWESVHYKAALGDVILENVLARQERSGVIDDFGVNLVQIDLEGHLASQSQRLADFFDKESPEVRFVNELMAAYRN
jgi:hypothetical protein